MIYYLISTTCISPVRRKWTNPKINKKYLLTIYGKNVVKREGLGVLYRCFNLFIESKLFCRAYRAPGVVLNFISLNHCKSDTGYTPFHSIRLHFIVGATSL